MRLAAIFVTLAFAVCGARVALFAGDAALPDRADVPVLKTSIYVGSVTLTTTAFTRTGEVFSATYEASVFPWTVGSEKGTITIQFPAADLERLLKGETVELTGEALNSKGKKHLVTAKAQPQAGEPLTGKLKVRVHASGTVLIFNGTYQLAAPETTPAPAP